MYSITQDALGRFHAAVPEIIRVFTLAIQKLDAYMASVPIHWSDATTLQKPAAEQRRVEEVEQVRECLRVGLQSMVGAFNEYLAGLGMSRVEILEAKKAASVFKGGDVDGEGKAKGKVVEMKQKQQG